MGLGDDSLQMWPMFGKKSNDTIVHLIYGHYYQFTNCRGLMIVPFFAWKQFYLSHQIPQLLEVNLKDIVPWQQTKNG